ncbi:MAG: glutaredoxin domain-containing protein [Planctomycetota bacterium]|nr:glutaredoxin domain-containing protein [Planctomycetota bacterium]MDA1112684.1 glutaredoxin domain-containing protein [Planctomycetota bacterium]
MAKIEIYTRTTCPYSIRAKSLLENNGQKREEIDLETSPERIQSPASGVNGCA